MSNFFVISGPSGVGKTTLTDVIKKENMDEIVHTISYTNRPKREGEVHGIDYYFTDTPAFQRKVLKDEFLAWDSVYGKLYGTDKQEVIDNMRRVGKTFVIFNDGGAKQVKERGFPAIYIYLLPPNEEELQKRLLRRGLSNNLDIRMAVAKQEMAKAHYYDHVIINRDFHESLEQLRKIMCLCG